ncbi:PLP-dependent aminotransferase family protein [Cocleimonas sp. KMM 6892]|uniref:aminotransferase-like domain-containing protein n=1 Tax=unclassified Cocleimonas TaxID=2639732 RepID=UPI002DBB89C3|nr:MULTISPECIES: PLP-dependent aminotransferase family protein [unclassified Cocleimonas]MEB8431684.1 PLP-dependent aminotransferase family protein [Cocleimonas sp. KMM 6892]MEC4713544.1 PLP-dependent aminotransferase family protein [Cocleimonas sp. KMM 6895]MEC4742875.1 PLP-dependent aminotransferase family protein [Cocleimonas sp. KMM 6896]
MSEKNSHLLSNRIKSVPKSFIREILKVSNHSDIISFAGGLPNASLFPVSDIAQASAKVLEQNGAKALQYSNTEGDLSLRNLIAQRYKEKQGIDVSPESILITNGSQQAFDLIAKALLNEGDDIIIENPGYLGAIQSFSLYQPNMLTVEVNDNGMDVAQLENVLQSSKPKFVYAVPNFQNPTGISYSQENREAVAATIDKYDTLLIQDDPYGELRFSGEEKESFYSLIPDRTIMLGTFSKVVVPSFRIGWIVAPEWLMDSLIIAKQASDLHTNYFSQLVMSQYLTDNSVDEHLETIIGLYSKQRDAMLSAIEEYFPEGVTTATSDGGMFLWVTLPEGMSSMELFDDALESKVAFVPGHPFYVGEPKENTMRLSYVTVDSETIREGIKRLGQCIKNKMQ